ncbi:MAG: hypothetical protein ACRDA0_10640 [Cetobacterium sp.]|uniref:hypothetical protein n=1 Tax=Cetobacterium sp. TaxID=2071632 RepID=UPI003F2E16F7
MKNMSIPTFDSLLESNLNPYYIAKEIKERGKFINNTVVKYDDWYIYINPYSDTKSVNFVGDFFNWESLIPYYKDDVTYFISNATALSRKVIRVVNDFLFNNDDNNILWFLKKQKNIYLKRLNKNLEENEEEIKKNLKKIISNFKEQLKMRGFYRELRETINKLDDSNLDVLKLKDLLYRITKTESLLKASIYITNIFNELEEIDEFNEISVLIDKINFYKKLLDLNIAFCKDDLDFELPISNDPNLYIKINNDLKIVKNFIFESLTPENIIYNKTKERFELYDVTPIGTNEDIEINWMELLEGTKTFYHHKSLSFPLSYNDVIKLGVDINEY